MNDLNIIQGILKKEAEPVLQIIEDYKASIKREAKENNIPLYHVSSTAPEDMKDGQIKPSYNKSQFHQNFGKMLCASTEEMESNPYFLARANGGSLIRLPIRERAYLIDKGNVSVTEIEGEKTSRLISNRNGYIYYLPIENFSPVVCLKYDRDCDDYKLVFENEWISEKPVKIPESVKSDVKKQGTSNIKALAEKSTDEVYAIESYTDVTSVLGHNQIFVNNNLKGDDIDYLRFNCTYDQEVKMELLNYIHHGRIEYVNRAADINYINIPESVEHGIKLKYDALAIINGPALKTTDELKLGQASLKNFIKKALEDGITYGEYTEVINNSAKDSIAKHNGEIAFSGNR
jgi:hypothetical protein